MPTMVGIYSYICSTRAPIIYSIGEPDRMLCRATADSCVYIASL